MNKRRRQMYKHEQFKQRHAGFTYLFCLLMAGFFLYGAATATKGGAIMVVMGLMFALCAVEDLSEIRKRANWMKSFKERKDSNF